ncbi:hypothetical protein DFH09DRAFT_1165309, partial [Mycena vulgaris]
GSVAIPLSAVSTATSVAVISQGASAQESGAQGAGGPDPKDDPRLAKFSLRARCEGADSAVRKNLDGKIVVLRNRKLRTILPVDGHPFSGFYLDYPVGTKPRGLLSTISKDPPELNWIYADNATLELKYGNKSTNWTDNRKALLLDDWEGFAALEESPGLWSVHYDRDVDHLRHVRGSKRRTLE